jgi:sigma-B regulation protein RsbU (phosphoserine phosphatase)
MMESLDLSRCRVLLVDDAKSSLDVLVEALQGHHLLSLAKDGESALKIIAQRPPDLVLLDLMMPGLDGYEVCRRLRAEPATHDLPIVFLSALGEAKSKARGFEAGGTDYITKPFEAVEVRARVRSLLKGKVYQDRARQSLAGELRVAHEIQRGMVPKDFASLGFGLPIDVHAVLLPAKEVGGDLYDVFPLGNGLVCFVLGDVSGKGIPAALFMAITATLLRATARHVKRPEEILSHVNQELSRDNPTCMFATLFCGVLDTESGQLATASGGHTSPVLMRLGQPPRLLEGHSGTLVGIQPNVSFQQKDTHLLPGDGLLLYTDGVTEAFDRDRHCFGDARLLGALSRAAPDQAPLSSEEMVKGVLEAVHAFSRGEPQSDDIALLAIRWVPAATLRLALRSTPADAARGYQAVHAFLAEHGVRADATQDVALAVEEALSNLVRHGYAGTEGPIELHVSLDAVAIKVEVRDQGIAFDPRMAQPPHLEVPLDERASGDLGIHIMKKAVDRIAYQREGSENLLTLVRDRNRSPTTE